MKAAKLLKDTLHNWREIKLNGDIDFEAAKKLLINGDELRVPKMIMNNDGTLESGYCSGCGHMHALTHPMVCKTFDCGCNVGQ